MLRKHYAPPAAGHGPSPRVFCGPGRFRGTVTQICLGYKQMQRNLHLSLSVNGEPLEASFAPYKTLLEVLREDLGLTGTKHGCELGECGACAVLIDGEPQLSCLVLAVECEGRRIDTVEGLARGAELHPLQAAFADLGAAQCGYCTPGILMTARALLEKEPSPTRDRIREAVSGNLCRCTGYQQIFEAIEEAATRLRAEHESNR
jgi:aerobic-type carbon monoxide dehydrogenase small subunit (CoxS/CutS family)